MERHRKPPRGRLPNPDDNSMHARHHQVQAMKHFKMPTYKDIIKEYQDKVASIQFRHDMLQRQKNANYVNEHHRLRGKLEHTVVRGADMHRLQNRMSELRRMLQEGL